MRKKTIRQRHNKELNGLRPTIKFGIPTPKLIKTWDELKECTSETHVLEIEDCCGWIHPIVPSNKNFWKHNHYLSTHTFYGGTHKESTRLLQACGFNIEIANWDE